MTSATTSNSAAEAGPIAGVAAAIASDEMLQDGAQDQVQSADAAVDHAALAAARDALEREAAAAFSRGAFQAVRAAFAELRALGAALSAEALENEAWALVKLGDAGQAITRLGEAGAISPPNERRLKIFGAAIREGWSGFILQDGHFELAARFIAHPRHSTALAMRFASEIALAGVKPLVSPSGDLAFGDTPAPVRRLMAAIMKHELVLDLDLEEVLVAVRRSILFSGLGADSAATEDDLALLEGFAYHAFANEMLWPETPEEAAEAEALGATLEANIRLGAPISAAGLFLYAAYRPLHRSAVISGWAARLAGRGAVDPALEHLVMNPLIERALAARMPALTEISGGVSSEVRAQYEENPYPRWRKVAELTPKPFVESILTEIAPNKPRLEATAKAPEVLIAGCGSGAAAISVAKLYANANVVAVDLSRASLAYGQRMAIREGLGNLVFAQADILKLGELEARFDVVNAGGVLHHMEDPEEGLRVLCRTLKPGGFFKIGLYSEIARRDVRLARLLIKERRLQPDLAGLRAFRDGYREHLRGPAKQLSASVDFYSASALRDLVFHVQEICYTIPELAEMLARNGLEFLGFSALPDFIRRAYAKEHPEDPAQIDLERWASFEEIHRGTFRGMYVFWVRKRAEA